MDALPLALENVLIDARELAMDSAKIHATLLVTHLALRRAKGQMHNVIFKTEYKAIL